MALKASIRIISYLPLGSRIEEEMITVGIDENNGSSLSVLWDKL